MKGRKPPSSCLEILRELLNYETNEYKLLQIVIFAQEEFRQTLAEHRNFADRINFYHVLGPLSFSETRRMLQFRLNQAQDSHRTPRLFTPLGLLAVYRATGGYPRKIIHLCHRVLVTMIIQNRTQAGWSVVQWCSKMLFPGEPLRVSWKTASVAAGLLVVFGIAILAAEPFNVPFFGKTAKMTALSTPQEEAPTLPAPDLSRTAAPLNSAEPEPTIAGSGPSGMELGEPDDTMDGTSEAAASSAADQVVVAAPEPAAVSRLLAAETPAKLPAIRSEEPAEAVSAGSSPPEILGRITVRPGDYLEQLIRRVYGFFDQQVLKAVLQVNPQIAERDNLAVGRTITFPLLPVRVGSLPKHACWVQVAEKDSLDDAYKLYRTYPRSAPPISILPYRNGRDGLKFAMLLKDCCIDKQAADAAIAGLPLPLADGARVQSKWDEGAFFPGSSELTPSMVD